MASVSDTLQQYRKQWWLERIPQQTLEGRIGEVPARGLGGSAARPESSSFTRKAVPSIYLEAIWPDAQRYMFSGGCPQKHVYRRERGKRSVRG